MCREGESTPAIPDRAVHYRYGVRLPRSLPQSVWSGFRCRSIPLEYSLWGLPAGVWLWKLELYSGVSALIAGRLFVPSAPGSVSARSPRIAEAYSAGPGQSGTVQEPYQHQPGRPTRIDELLS